MAAETASAGWWQRNGWTAVLLTAFFVIALFIRSYFNFEASYNGGDWRWSGTDPYYHMRVVDHIRATGEFLLFDSLINYPIGAMNPRPPIFDWTIAAFGGLLAPFFGGDGARATDFVAAFSPAVWGALTVFPMYALGNAAFGRKAGLWAAFFIAVMAAHVTRSNLGGVDHDATILFFLTLGAFYMVKALRLMEHRVYVEDYRRAGTILPGFRSFFRDNPAAIAYAALHGVAVAAIALTWQGFAYAYGIFAVWYGFQLLSNHLRTKDSTGHFLLAVVSFLVTIVMIWPYYEAVNRVHSYVYPLLYIFAGVLLASLIFVPTRHLPPILVIPTTIGAAVLGILVLLFVLPDIGRLFFTGLGYFVQTKLYSTIAEAQRTPLGYLVFATGVVPFFFGLAGIVFALIAFVRRKRDDLLFVLVWAAVALIMSFTATRFVFNASVGFAVLAGWVTARFVAWIRFGEVRKSWRSVRSAGHGLAKTTRSSIGARHVFGSIFLVFLLLLPTVWGGVDAGVPGEYVAEQQGNDRNSFRYEFWENYFGAFGQDFLSSHWIDALGYLSEQDTHLEPEERPAFIAWWDYGFYAVDQAKHPTVADPFQFGYQISGRFLSSQSEAEGITWMAIRLLEGNVVRGEKSGTFDADVAAVLDERAPGLAESLERPLRTRDYNTAYRLIVETIPGESADVPAEDEIVALYRDLEEATGDSIRYFALEGRMFPCDDHRTPQIDSGSIFYAPVYLADKNPDDFVRTTYRDASGQRYFQKIYEEGPDGRSQQIEDPHVVDNVGNKYLVGGDRLYPMAANGYIDYEHPLSTDGIIIQGEELEYQQLMYNSLLYRAWIGPAPANLEEKIPPTSDYAPGEDLKHFRVVYTTVRTAPTDDANRCSSYSQGVMVLEYYEGAPVTGRVVDNDGDPLAGVTVRVTDNFGIVHDRTETDADGNFELSAPFSNEEDPAERASRERPNTLRGVGPNRIEVFTRGSVVASENFTVSKEQAAGGGAAIAPFELRVSLGRVSGVVFDDEAGDGLLNETDARIAGAVVRFENRNTTTDDQGRFSFDKVPPGAVTLQVTADGYSPGTRGVTVPPGGNVTADVPLDPAPVAVNGTLTYEGTPVAGATVRASMDANDPEAGGAKTSVPSDADGNYTVELEAGTWYLSVDYNTVEDNRTVRYYTEDPIEVEVARDSGAITRNIALSREEL